MNTFGLKTTLVSGAVALGLLGCGGSGGDAQEGGAAASEVKLAGTAGTGLAPADGTGGGRWGCGTGTAVTDGAGSYTVTVTDGALPCVIRVTGTADGVPVTLHSVAEAGSTSGATTTATANVTPLTEMVMAQLAKGMPTSFFDSFGAGSTVTTEQLSAATDTLLTALANATGIDLGSIDPFKATLVPATSTTPGNAYDDALEALKAKISLEALPLVVNQIASVASSPASGSDAPTLATVMESVNAGSMPGCGHVMSGRYRFVEFATGRVFVNNIDFGKKAFTRPDGTTGLTMGELDTAKPCEFTASGTNTNGHDVTFGVQMGQGGTGAFRVVNSTTGGSSTGYIFPVQAHPVSALQGDWTLLSSGNYENQWEHILSRISFAADGKATVCDYDTIENPVCLPVEDTVAATSRADGGFDMAESDGSGFQTWLYRAPDGSVIAYGTANPTGDSTAVDRSTLVATRQRKLPLPEVDSVVKFTEFQTVVNSTLTPPYRTAQTADSVTYTAVDTATSTATRKLTSTGRIDKLQINYPIDGTRFRAAGTDPSTSLSFIDVLQLPVSPGMAVIFSTNPETQYVHSIVVNRP